MDTCLHEVVALIARERPESVAVSGSRRLTYAELDRAADAWAARMAGAGAAPGQVVPILLPRSPQLVVALLAALKAGCAYALFDQAWPPARLVETIERLDAPFLVTELGDVPGLRLDRWVPPGEQVAPVPGFVPATPDASAVCTVFLTSGTTGAPKLVPSSHRATARLFEPRTFAKFSPNTVTALAAAVSWDGFSLELWSALLNGGTSAIVPEPFLSPQALRTSVSEHGTNTVFLTTSLFNMIVDEDPAAFEGLELVMIGGERLSPGHVGRFLRTHAGIALVNGYGPVENTVFTTTHLVSPEDCARPLGIPLGTPVPGTQVHVLDGDRPCPAGKTGEICVSGDGLAQGYLGDPERTAKAFTTVTIDGRAELLYRTGDLGVRDANGLLHFQGRTDRQVKIRGYRVEPGDVEHQVLRLLPAVRSCRVLARRAAEDGPLELVVCCVPAEPGDPLPDALSVLNRALVPHQRPAAVVVVDAFPLTANGKLDERALLTVASQGERGPVVEEIRYHDQIERVVARAFGSVLDLPAVPPDVPFWQLGGTSLDAGRVCARLSAALGAPVPVSRLYQHPSVAELATWARETTPVPLHPEHGPVPLTPMQALFLRRHLADDSGRSEHCLLVWTVEGEIDQTALEKAIAVVHGRHAALSASYLPTPEPHAAPAGSTPPRLVVLPAQAAEAAAVTAVRAELGKRLNLARGEVWRAALVPLPDRSVFGCVVHHIAFDGWSESVLAHDLATAYDRARGLPRELQAAPPSPATIHSGRQASLARAGLPAQRDRTARELTGTPPVRWPSSATSPSPEPGVVEAMLTPATVAAVDALAARTGVSRFVVLLAHYAGAVAELTGQRDFGIGVPIAHRDRPDLERVVGCHIDMTCMRIRGAALNAGPSGVTETGRIVRRALSAQDVAFADQVALSGPQAPDRPALFQILFALQDNKTPRLDITGARSRFHRQHYLDLPLELHTELWPDDDGGLWMTLYHRTEIVGGETARRLAAEFTRRLHRI